MTRGFQLLVGLILAGSIGCDIQTHLPASDLDRQRTAGVPDGSDPVSIRPQIVRIEKIEIRGGAKYITMANNLGRFSLRCNSDLKTCITPAAGTDYFLFTKETRWKFPHADSPLTLQGVQDWEGEYKNQQNVGLIAVSYSPSKGWEMQEAGWGILWMESWEASK